MSFSEKLSNAMDVLNISNASLAKALRVDPSSISRIKTGTRGTPKPQVVQKISEYLALKNGGKDQSSLFLLIKNPKLQTIMPFEELVDLISEWLTESSDYPDDSLENIFHNIDDVDPPPEPFSSICCECNDVYPETTALNTFNVYRGDSGKRQALFDFLSYISKGTHLA